MSAPDREADHATFMRQAVALAVHGVEAGEGGPFGALVVKDGVVIGQGSQLA